MKRTACAAAIAAILVLGASAAVAADKPPAPAAAVVKSPAATTAPKPAASPTPVVKSPAKPAVKPAAIGPTVNDVRICLGVDGSTAQEQIDMCSKILATGKVKQPYVADYYATRGAAYFAVNKLDLAFADLNKAIALRQAPEFVFQRALVQLSRHNIDAAKTDLAQVMKLKPNFTPAYLIRGIVAFRAGDHAEALSFFDAAVKRVPTYYQALFARGVAKKRTGDEAGGVKDIADARGMSPTVDGDLKKFGLTP